MPETLKKTNPATGEVIAEVPCTPAAEVAGLVQRARAAQKAWGAMSAQERGKRVRKMAAALTAHGQEVVELVSQETGKPQLEATLNELFNAAMKAHYFGKNAHCILKPKSIPLAVYLHRRSYVTYAPRGVIGIISPWNFPLAIPFGDTVMALAAGNAVVLKPSEVTPLCGLKIKEMAVEAGIDPELLQVATGRGDVGAAVVQGGVDMVHFTGSVATGRKIAEACGKLLIPCTLELGGKDAAIVLEDADVEHAARTLAFGAFLNAGQACASVERVYAVGDVYEPLVKRLVELAGALRQGDGSTADVDVGPMIVGMQLDIVKRHVEEAKERGATILAGGEAQGPYYRPTVLTDVTDDMAVCRDESFGPLLPVMRAQSVDEAVERANNSIYGLSAYVFGRNTERARRVAERLQAGTIDVNDVLFTHAAPELPWGGEKASGIGRTHSDDGLRHMCEARHVNYSPYPAFQNVWLFPYKKALVPPSLELLEGVFSARPWPKRLGLLWRGLVGAVKAFRST